jgi:hypothetical protein
MKEPNMGIEVGLKTAGGLETVEKIAPLAPKSASDITPQPLNAYIVNTSTNDCMRNKIQHIEVRTPPKCARLPNSA